MDTSGLDSTAQYLDWKEQEVSTDHRMPSFVLTLRRRLAGIPATFVARQPLSFEGFFHDAALSSRKPWPRMMSHILLLRHQDTVAAASSRVG